MPRGRRRRPNTGAGASDLTNQLKMSPTADWPASSPYIFGTMEPGTMPQRPGMSGSWLSIGATIMSQVLVPMIFTSVPALMPAPTAPMWASKAPTATATPAGRPTFAATSAVSEPAFWSEVKARAA